jgi:hypothetical protein
MGLPPLPQLLDLTSQTDDEVDLSSGLGPALVQDSWYELQLQVVDQNGDVFDLGPTSSPLWTFEAQLRDAVYDEDAGVADLSFTCVVEDGPLGLVLLKASPAETAALVVSSGRWDVQMTNAGDTSFDPLYRSVLFRGAWSLIQDVTRV